jgi:hypothetical protein
MGKKPLVGLIGLVCAGIALTGCDSMNNNRRPVSQYKPGATFGSSANSNATMANNNTTVTGPATPAKDAVNQAGAVISPGGASPTSTGFGTNNNMPGGASTGFNTPPANSLPSTSSNSLRPAGTDSYGYGSRPVPSSERANDGLNRSSGNGIPPMPVRSSTDPTPIDSRGAPIGSNGPAAPPAPTSGLQGEALPPPSSTPTSIGSPPPPPASRDFGAGAPIK